jgi:hypothetical protein
VAEVFAVLAVPEDTVSVATPPSLLVTSDTTTTVVDVLPAVSRGGEGKVGRFVVDKMVEMFAGVDVFEETIDAAVVDEQILVVLKPKFPVANSHMIKLVEGAAAALYAISGLPINVAPDTRVVFLINGEIVPI